MRIKLLSDLHFEHHDDAAELIQNLDSNFDLLVLAGDIDTHDRIEDTLSNFCREFPEVLFVPGNHEYYKSTPQSLEAILDVVNQQHSNLTIFYSRNRSASIQGLNFHGSTAWFRDDPGNLWYEHNLTDFSQISGLKPWVYGEQKKFQEHLEENLAQGDIVITHHLPSPICVAEQFKTSALNRFFVCDYSDMILDRKPKLWMFGHTHSAFDDYFGDTRLVCNPRGYPGELNIGFDVSKVVEI